MKKVDSQMSLPRLENEVLDYWDKEAIFQKSFGAREKSPNYSFYDGPPFATGSPHYGHILQSITKDVVPRYWTMRVYG
ncbi:MAG TPA: class I tRNA ligase family protein [bacterium]|mgnify:CR=1 FL=1|nr:class I tRNA ligase family protein [bacterium]